MIFDIAYLNESISIHAPGEGSDFNMSAFLLLQSISIHAPGEGSDGSIEGAIYEQNISIHAPGEGSDRLSFFGRALLSKFQSTLPVKGATFQVLMTVGNVKNFNPRSR